MSEQHNPNIINATDDNFKKEVLEAAIPVLVDFWAPWCGPCRMVAPHIEAIAETYLGKVKIVKINIDENPQTPSAYNVRGIPTLLIFKNGKLQATKVGALTKNQLTDFLNENI